MEVQVLLVSGRIFFQKILTGTAEAGLNTLCEQDAVGTGSPCPGPFAGPGMLN